MDSLLKWNIANKSQKGYETASSTQYIFKKNMFPVTSIMNKIHTDHVNTWCIFRINLLWISSIVMSLSEDPDGKPNIWTALSLFQDNKVK